MEYDSVDNLNDEQILKLYNDVLERGDYIAARFCPPGFGTGNFETVCYELGCYREEICMDMK